MEACAMDASWSLWRELTRTAAWQVGLSVAVAAGVAMLVWRASTRARAPVVYAVPAPEPPEPAVAVEVASLRAPGSSAVQCYAPATGRFLGLVNAASPAAVDRAVAAAATAQPAWAATSFDQRRRVLRSLLRHVLDNAHAICRVAALDSGKTMVDAHLGEILVTAERIRWTLAHGEAALRPSRRPTNLLMAHKRNTLRYEPMGVVAALVSWNYPFHNLMGPVVSALFAGNAIVVKASEHTAWSAAYFAAIACGALEAHGHDARLVHALVCWPATAAHLTAHPGIRHITFIGSQPVARLVAASAARALMPVVAELGGKDPFIVLDSAAPDLPCIAELVLRGAFQAAGQNCIGVERLIAAPAVYARLVAMLAPRVAALRLGPDADVGALVSDAVSRGARLLAGGRRHLHPDYPRGHYFQPTLLADVTPDMPIARHECFAPILVAMPAPSSAPADVLAIANAPDFGLGASVHAHHRDPALEPVVRGLKAGMVAVNDFAAYYAVQLPFGGVAGSGYGRFAGAEGLRALCNLKSVCEDRFAWLGIRTAIPPPLRYPVASQPKAWAFTHGVVELGYGEPARKFRGLARIIKNS